MRRLLVFFLLFDIEFDPMAMLIKVDPDVIKIYQHSTITFPYQIVQIIVLTEEINKKHKETNELIS